MAEFTEKDVQMLTGMMNGQSSASSNQGAAAPGAGGSTTEPGAEGAAAATQQQQTPPPAAGATAQPSGTAAGQQQPPAGSGAAATEQQQTPPAFDFSKVAGGKYKTLEELDGALSRVTTLEQELASAKATPKFKSQRAEVLYNYANKLEDEGMTVAAMQQFLNLAELPLDKLPDHELRFQAFALDPKWKGLSQDDLKAVFADNELKQFGDPSVENGQTPVQKIMAKQATSAAREQLATIQKQWTEAKPATPSPQEILEQRTQYQAQVKQKLSGFDGIEVTASTLDEATQKNVEAKINYKLDASGKQLERVAQSVTDPQGWWESLLVRHGVIAPNGEGELDQLKFGQLVTRFEYQQELINQAYSQGRHDALADGVKSQRNASPVTDTSTPPPGDKTKKSAHDEMIEGAMKTVGV